MIEGAGDFCGTVVAWGVGIEAIVLGLLMCCTVYERVLFDYFYTHTHTHTHDNCLQKKITFNRFCTAERQNRCFWDLRRFSSIFRYRYLILVPVRNQNM